MKRVTRASISIFTPTTSNANDSDMVIRVLVPYVFLEWVIIRTSFDGKTVGTEMVPAWDC